MVKTLYDNSYIRFYDTVIINLDKHYCYLPHKRSLLGREVLRVVGGHKLSYVRAVLLVFWILNQFIGSDLSWHLKTSFPRINTCGERIKVRGNILKQNILYKIHLWSKAAFQIRLRINKKLWITNAKITIYSTLNFRWQCYGGTLY